MQLSQASAEKIMADMNMDDMPLIMVRPTNTSLPTDWLSKYKMARQKFMTSLTDAVEELVFLNLGQQEFMDLLTGRSIPENMSIRMRVPIFWGGEIAPENMFMCSTFPHSQNIDRFIIAQIGYEAVWVPNPAKKVYVSAHTTGGGDGGNATEDRLAQMAAQIAASRGME